MAIGDQPQDHSLRQNLAGWRGRSGHVSICGPHRSLDEARDRGDGSVAVGVPTHHQLQVGELAGRGLFEWGRAIPRIRLRTSGAAYSSSGLRPMRIFQISSTVRSTRSTRRSRRPLARGSTVSVSADHPGADGSGDDRATALSSGPAPTMSRS